MKKIAIGGAITAAVLGGSVAVAALTPIGAAFAGNRNQPVALTAAADPGSTTPNGQAPKGPRGQGNPKLDQALSDLVKDGTLTQDQADKVKQKLQSVLGGGGRGRPGFGGGAFISGGLDAVAKSIGITTDQLRTELQGGNKSIADVAKAHNVDPQKVINDLVAAAKSKIDDAVKSGKLQQSMADKIESNLTNAITKLVNNPMPRFGFGPGHRGPGAPGANGNTANPNGQPANPSNPPANPPSSSAPPSSDSPTTAAPAPSDTPAPSTSSPDTSGTQPSGTVGG
jgi:hypothetical protein